MPSHSDLFRKLLPPGEAYSDDPASLHLTELAIWGQLFDKASTDIDGMINEIFPDTIEDSLDEWEAELNIVNDTSLPTYQRMQNILTKYITQGDLSILCMQMALFPYLGYFVTITESKVFRTDSLGSKVDVDAIQDSTHVYLWTVTIETLKIKTEGFRVQDIVNTLNRVMPAWTGFVLIIDGFRADESKADSITTLAR